jgi:hypothetical protein
MPDTQAVLVEQLESLIEKGDERAARAFVMEHLKEFPEELQRSLAVDLFSDALDETARSQENLMRMKEKAVEAIEQFEEEEKNPSA